MHLYLMQHGKSKSKDEDPDRALTDEGRGEVERVVAFLSATAAFGGGAIRHSGKTRARETAETLAAVFTDASIEPADGLGPMDDPVTWVQRVGMADESLVLIGHLPHLARLTSLLLIGQDDRAPVLFSNGGMVCLERDDGGEWSLSWSITPALMT